MRLMQTKKIIKNLSLCLFIFGIFSMTFLTLDGQVGRGRERLIGKVLDADGKPLEGAAVVIKFKGHYRLEMTTRKVEFMPYDGEYGEMKFETQTDVKGKFRFIGLGYGQWEISAIYGDLKPDVRLIVLDKEIGRRNLTFKLEEDTPGTPNTINFTSSGDDEEESDDSGDSGVIDFTKPMKELPPGGSTPQRRGVPKDPEKLFKIGEALLKKDELEKAAQAFYMASIGKPEWSAPYLKMGYTYFNLGEMEKALENFQKFIELDPKSPEAPTVQEMIEILKEE